MRILIYGINYAPELTGIGKYTAEMAESLSALGHTVRVICAPPYYPEWRVGEGYSVWRYRSERQGPIGVFRAPLWVPRRPQGLKRLLHLASFAVSSLPLLLAHLRWRPELVIAVAPSLLNAPAAWLIGRAARARTWLHVQDYEIDAAFGLGVLKGRRLRNAALAGEGWLMRRFDIVSSISQRMVEHGLRKGVSAMKLVELTNWVDVNAIFPLRRPSRYRATLRIPDDTVVVLYSGNMGAKQGLTILAEVAQTLAHRTDIVFVFCGDGPSKADLVEHCAGLENCRFLSLQPAAHLNELLNLADIHVLPQRANAADLVMPSKLMGMLASGRAIIATAVEGTELSNVVSPVGLIVPPEDANALASAIERLAVDAEFRHRQGISARNVATSRFSRESVMRRLDARIRACCNR